MKKKGLSIVHYYNKAIAPFDWADVSTYPVYIKITHKTKVTRIKSKAATEHSRVYGCTSINDPDLQFIIKRESRAICTLIEFFESHPKFVVAGISSWIEPFLNDLHSEIYTSRSIPYSTNLQDLEVFPNQKELTSSFLRAFVKLWQSFGDIVLDEILYKVMPDAKNRIQANMELAQVLEFYDLVLKFIKAPDNKYDISQYVICDWLFGSLGKDFKDFWLKESKFAQSRQYFDFLSGEFFSSNIYEIQLKLDEFPFLERFCDMGDRDQFTLPY